MPHKSGKSKYPSKPGHVKPESLPRRIGKDIASGVRQVSQQVPAAIGTVREGVRKIKRAIKRT